MDEVLYQSLAFLPFLLRGRGVTETCVRLPPNSEVISKYHSSPIFFGLNNGNRTEWSKIRSLTYEDLQNRTTEKRESDLLITSMMTDRIKRHEVLLPVNQS